MSLLRRIFHLTHPSDVMGLTQTRDARLSCSRRLVVIRSALPRRSSDFRPRDVNADICVMNAAGTGKARLTRSPAAESTPTWSPDGQQIAFLKFPNAEGGHPQNIFVMDADGSGERQLTRENW